MLSHSRDATVLSRVLRYVLSVPLLARLRLTGIVVGVVAALSGGCEQRPSTWTPPFDAGTDAPPFVCSVTAPSVCPDPPTRYSDVAPIFHDKCVPCHFGAPGGPWPLQQYQQAVDWFDTIMGHMINCTMPPVEYLSILPMTTDERLAILNWILCGRLE
jgi:hypothetical protein